MVRIVECVLCNRKDQQQQHIQLHGVHIYIMEEKNFIKKYITVLNCGTKIIQAFL